MQKQVNEGGGVGVVSEWRPGYWWPAQGSSLSPPAPFPERTSRAWIIEPSKDRKFSGQWPYDNGPFLLFPRTLLACGKNARMKHQRFTEVCQKILSAVVAGIEVEFVPDAFCLELPVEFRSSVIKSEFILTAAIEID